MLVLSAALLAATVLFTGCYWSPDSQGGDVAVSITLPSSVSGSGELGALNTPTTFLYVFVLDEGVMTVSPVQAALIHARIAYGDVTYAMEQAITSNENNLSQAADGFSMPVGLSSSKFQQLAVAASGTGTRAFSDLPAGREFLVGAYAVAYDGEVYTLYLGYGTATVRAGSSTAVNIELGQDPIPFFDYIAESYALTSVRVFEGADTPTGEPLYFDMALSDGAGIDSVNSTADFDAWYADEFFPIDVAREQQSKSQGDRRPFRRTTSGSNDFAVVGVLPNRTWKLLVTTWPERGRASDSGDDVWLSDSFTTPPSGEFDLGSYDFTFRGLFAC